MKCPHCDSPIEPGQAFCGVCFLRVDRRAISKRLIDEDQDSSLKEHLPATISLVTLIVATFGVASAAAGFRVALFLLLGLAVFAAIWIGAAFLFTLSCRIFREEMNVPEAGLILFLAWVGSSAATWLMLLVSLGGAAASPFWFCVYSFLAGAGVCAWRMEIDFLKAIGICLLYEAMISPIVGLSLFLFVSRVQ